MLAILYALGKLTVDPLKLRSRLEAENLLLAISSTFIDWARVAEAFSIHSRHF
jgi:hypothetical protein